MAEMLKASIGHVLRSRAWKGAGPVGVTPTQGHALGLLRDEPEGLPLGTVASRLGVSAPTGEALADATRDWPAFLAEAVETLEPAEQAAFLRMLVKIIRAMQQSGDIAPQKKKIATCRYFRPNVHEGASAPHHCAFVDAPFGDRHLRLNWPEQEIAAEETQAANWRRFAPAA